MPCVWEGGGMREGRGLSAERRYFAALCALLVGSIAQGSIQWETTRQTLRPKRGEATVRTAFRFINRGAPVRVRHISTSCGCTEAKLDDRELGSGEAGELVVVFRIESQRGVLRKYIRVETDDPSRRVEELMLVVEIPETVWVAPRFVWWEGRGERVGRSFWVDAVGDVRIKSVRATATKSEWRVGVKAERDGLRYRVDLRPPDNAPDGSTVVAISVGLKDGDTISLPVFARVFGARHDGEGRAP